MVHFLGLWIMQTPCMLFFCPMRQGLWPFHSLHFSWKANREWKWKCSSLSCVPFFVTLWTVARQAPLSMGFPGKDTGWVATSSARKSSQPRDQTFISCVFWIAGRFFTGGHGQGTSISPNVFFPLFSLFLCPLKYTTFTKLSLDPDTIQVFHLEVKVRLWGPNSLGAVSRH